MTFRRNLWAFVLATAACDGTQSAADLPLPTLSSIGGPEVVLLRFPRAGGVPRSYRWPAIDSPIWTGSEKLPALNRVLAFDDGGGMVALVAADGRAGRLDLRTGKLQLSAKPLVGAASVDGWTVYGVNFEGRVARSTPTAEWRGPMTKADTILALPAGNVAMVSFGERTRMVRFHPPAVSPMDTLDLGHVESIVRTVSGDRLYARTDRGLITVDAREWRIAPGPRTARTPLAIAPTPSGDRALILDADGRTIRIWMRYAERFAPPITLSAPANDLRMDPLGRFVLARTELVDSAFVISVPLGRVIRAVPTEWRADLPIVAPNGTVLTLRRDEVHVLDPVTGARRTRIRNGGLDLWAIVRWDGFRPRDRSLDAPAVFETEAADSAANAETVDSLLAAHAAVMAAEKQDSIGRAETRAGPDTIGSVFTLSFASLLNEAAARSLAGRIRVDGRPPRVVAGSRDGVTIYRVVLGPYATREAADAAGRRSGVPYWVFVGLP